MIVFAFVDVLDGQAFSPGVTASSSTGIVGGATGDPATVCCAVKVTKRPSAMAGDGGEAGACNFVAGVDVGLSGRRRPARHIDLTVGPCLRARTVRGPDSLPVHRPPRHGSTAPTSSLGVDSAGARACGAARARRAQSARPAATGPRRAARYVLEQAENIHLRHLLTPPSARGHCRGQLALGDQPHRVAPSGLPEHPADVNLPPSVDATLHGSTLTALDQVGVLAENREPERKIGIRDPVQRTRGRQSTVRTDRPHLPRLPEPVESVVDPLLGGLAMRDRRHWPAPRAPSTRSYPPRQSRSSLRMPSASRSSTPPGVNASSWRFSTGERSSCQRRRCSG